MSESAPAREWDFLAKTMDIVPALGHDEVGACDANEL